MGAAFGESERFLLLDLGRYSAGCKKAKNIEKSA
jgi:hypothetical protein